MRKAEARQRPLHAAESLEARLALSVSAMMNGGLASNQAEGLPSDWAVILGSHGDDIFMQRIATGSVGPGSPQDPTGFNEQDFVYANNSSFLNNGPGTFGRIADIDLVDTIYVTNGQEVTVSGVKHDHYPLESTSKIQAPFTTTFVLSRATIEATEACVGTISYAGNYWSFTNGVVENSDPDDPDVYPFATFTFTFLGVGSEPQIRPIDISFSSSNSASGDARAVVTWSGLPVEVPNVIAGPRLDSIRYDANKAQRVATYNQITGDLFYSVFNQDFTVDVGRLPSSGPSATFTVPVTNVHPGGIVNGTLSGFIDVTGDGAPDFSFAPAQLFGPLENRLVFTNLTTGAGPSLTGAFRTADADSNARTLQGGYDPLRGKISFQFFDGGNPQALNGDVTIVQAHYATYDQDPLPMTATFFAGLDIHNEIYVDLLTSGSTISVESPIIHNAQDTELKVGADIDLRATNVNIDAQLSAFDSIRIGPSNVAFPAIAQARAYAVVGATGTPQQGQIVGIVVPPGGGGQGYNPLVLPVTVTIDPPPGGVPPGVRATAQAVVQGGVITAFNITNPGSGYDFGNPPHITIAGPPAQPPVPAEMVPPPGLSPGNAQGFAVLAGGKVKAIGVPPGLGGQGYDPLNLPAVTIAAPPVGGTQATATAIVEYGVVIGFSITNEGSGYTTIPAVSIAAPPDLPPIGLGFIDPKTNAYPVSRPTGVAPVAERVSINASVAAQFYDIHLGDDPNTAAIPRGRLFISTSGSLSGSVPATPGAVTTAAQRVFLQANNADVLVEGVIYATEQTYLLQSAQAENANPTSGLEPEHTPFVFSTRSPATGSQTGLIRGGTVAVTLGNDTPTPEVGASALNTVDLQTRVDSIRVKAATRSGAPLTGPFPYDLTINEVDNVSIDAVAASSRPITLSAGGSMQFNAALATASDLRFTAAGAYTMTAPVSTTRGMIDIAGKSIIVANSMRVLDPVYDPARTDITIQATGGDMVLNGLVSAVNNVNLIQANAGTQFGTVGGSARVVAARLNVESQGSVSLFTNVDRLDGVAAIGFKVDEQDDIAITSLRSGGLVSLRAAGVDAGLDTRYTDNARALTANLIDVTNLEASAPAGSIEIIANTAKTLVLGQAKAIAAGQAASMQAAGDVVIRSTAGDIDVLDAPLAGAPLLAVRVATTANLSATYAQNVPGTRASTLTANSNGSLNTAGIDGVTNLWVGDRILVKNQTTQSQNGIYMITSLGSATSKWVLTRAGDADTTAELAANTRLVVQDGTQAGKVFGFSYTDVLGTVPMVMAVVPNRPGALLVRAATTGSLFGSYTNATGTLAATANGSLPLIDGVALSVGDFVLVRKGTHTVVDPRTLLPVNTTQVSNGVYKVVSLGSGTSKWQLKRVDMSGADWTSSTPLNSLLGYVNVREGVLSTPSVGGVYRVGFDSLGISALTATEQAFATEIGSDRLSSVVKFVVSSGAGTNMAAGSLGKMIAVRQKNAETRMLDGQAAGAQAMDFRFSTLVTAPIQLTQQLPAITKAFRIDGGQRYTPAGTATSGSSRIVVDGSRIGQDRFGRTLFTGTLSVQRPTANTIVIPAGYSRFGEIRVGMLVTGSQIKQGTRITAIDSSTRTLTLTANSVVGAGSTAAPTSVTIFSQVNGLDFVSGSGAALDSTNVLQPGAVLANVNVGGFESGAAITIQGVDGVVVRDSVIGQQVSGGRMSSRYGVLVSDGVKSATLLNNIIVGSAGAGVRIQDSASGVVMVGNTIGTASLPNQIGVEIESTGSNRIGADPILPGRALGAVTVARNAAGSTITMPANYTAWGDLFNNLGVKGPGIADGARILAIDQTKRSVTLTTNGSTPGGVTSSGSGSVTFGNFVNTTQFGTTLVLPVGVTMDDLFLGQVVSGAGIPSGTTITAINQATSSTRTITLSNALTATATGVSVTFSSPSRNQIAFNRYGVWLAVGGNTVTNSDIYSSTLDGVRITGGTQKVGTSATASAKSNAIYSNGGYGVNVDAAVAANQVVQGNYLGTRAPGNVRVVNALGNINVKLMKWNPDSTTNVDPQGNVHGPAQRTGSGSGSGGTTRAPGGIFPL